MVLGTKVGLSPDHFVLDGDPAPPPKKGSPAQFSAHFYCGQTTGCVSATWYGGIGLSPGDFVLDEDPAPSPKRGSPLQIFSPCLLWPNGWRDQDGTWHKGRPQPRRLCVTWGPSPILPKKGRSALPNFRPMSIVAKRMDGLR